MKRIFTFTFTAFFLALFLPVLVYAANLPVPFVVQAPHANWQQPYQDACEEASITMLDAFFDGDTRENMDAWEADGKILDLVRLEREVLGYDKDTDLADMAQIINDHYSFEAYVVDDPSLQQIQKEIDAGHPVVVPAWGRDLRNLHFTPPGPTYHTVVVSGYDDTSQEFITQEPGTRHGRDFRYAYNDLMGAMADLLKDSRGLPVPDGPPRALFVKQARLVKSVGSPKVYLVKNGMRQHVTNEQVFLGSGFKWGEIEIVSDSYLSSLTKGVDITSILR